MKKKMLFAIEFFYFIITIIIIIANLQFDFLELLTFSILFFFFFIHFRWKSNSSEIFILDFYFNNNDYEFLYFLVIFEILYKLLWIINLNWEISRSNIFCLLIDVYSWDVFNRKYCNLYLCNMFVRYFFLYLRDNCMQIRCKIMWIRKLI